LRQLSSMGRNRVSSLTARTGIEWNQFATDKKIPKTLSVRERELVAGK
jgi:hypothetical protein